MGKVAARLLECIGGPCSGQLVRVDQRTYDKLCAGGRLTVARWPRPSPPYITPDDPDAPASWPYRLAECDQGGRLFVPAEWTAAQVADQLKALDSGL